MSSTGAAALQRHAVVPSQVLRTMQVVFSSSMPQGSCCYVVGNGGLRSLSPEEVERGIALGAERAGAEQAGTGQEQRIDSAGANW